ncbi:MAG: translation initiation inhibitor [Ramlibacter sp.]|jgi:2-iminobutanoate/2-iminopropanoate deaminase|uniref:RidA family protein n=1 Tax=Ramlibacter sp. TaxID=1917967 RepID=UPI00261E3DC4|nr:RidA family protein [Ramlibacter sp.]MDB5749642.1 translation initiation inhibitor [Ramlibacter sp.]
MSEGVAIRRLMTSAVAELESATWSNAFCIGNEVVMSGMTAHPATRHAAEPMDAYAQTTEVLRKLLAYVEAAGGNVRNLYKLVIYVTDVADKDQVGRARRDFFQAPYPCSTLVEVKGLVFPELKIEIDAWARLDVDLSRCE